MTKQQLTKKERYFLRKEQKQEERLQAARRRKNKKAVKIALPVVLGVGLLVLGIIFLPDGSGNSLAKIEVPEKEYDAGFVSMKNGLVKHTFEIKSAGQEPLEIKKIWTSCMCTTARLRVGDETSGEFGMHNNPVFWSQKIEPGSAGYLEVVFDPAFHGPSGTGAMLREVYLSTNDPQNKQAKVKMLINVGQ